MLQLLPPPSKNEKTPALLTLLRPAAPARGLVYTLLRHGRGLAPAQCARRLETLLPQDDGPFQAA